MLMARQDDEMMIIYIREEYLKPYNYKLFVFDRITTCHITVYKKPLQQLHKKCEYKHTMNVIF